MMTYNFKVFNLKKLPKMATEIRIFEFSYTLFSFQEFRLNIIDLPLPAQPEPNEWLQGMQPVSGQHAYWFSKRFLPGK